MTYNDPPEPDQPHPESEEHHDGNDDPGTTHPTADTSPPTPPHVPASEEELLAGMSEAAELLHIAETNKVFLAAEWGRTHLADPLPEFLQRAYDRGDADEQELGWYQLSKVGLPYVDEFSIPSFAQAAKITEYQARKLIRSSLILTYLLPRVLSKVVAGTIPVFAACLLAQECWDLTHEAVEFIDQAMADPAARHTEKGRENVIIAAKHAHMAETLAAEELAAAESRHVTINPRTNHHGTVDLFATVDLPGAIALDAALSCGAAFLKANGCEESLDVRRSYALIDLAELGLAHATGADATDREGSLLTPAAVNGEHAGAIGQAVADSQAAVTVADRPRWGGNGLTAMKVKFYVHFAATSPGGSAHPTDTGGVDGLVKVTGTGLPPEGITAATRVVREWFTRHKAGHSAKITLTPVINLNEQIQTGSYTPTSRMKEFLYLRDSSCVFPFCTQPATETDCDHIQSWVVDSDGNPIGGATCTCSVAPLCRRHHLNKTHGKHAKNGTHTEWSYSALGDGNFIWSGPGGKQLLRSPTETRAVRGVCKHTETAEKVWTMLEVTEAAAQAHHALTKTKTERFEKAITLAGECDDLYRVTSDASAHPSRVGAPTNHSGEADPTSSTHPQVEPPPF